MREIRTYLKAAGPVLWFKPVLTIVLCTSHLAAALIFIGSRGMIHINLPLQI
jgi:hypothetical protein